MIEGSKKASPGLPGGSDCKEPLAMWETQGSIPGLGRSPGGEHGNQLQ